jgi:hypothetical protein
MARIPVLSPLVPKGDGRTVKPEPKRADPFYQSAGHEAFRRSSMSSRSSFRRMKVTGATSAIGRCFFRISAGRSIRNTWQTTIGTMARSTRKPSGSRNTSTIEIGTGLKTDAWAGAEFWADAEDETITLDHLLDVCRDEPTADTKLRPQVWEYS